MDNLASMVDPVVVVEIFVFVEADDFPVARD